MVRYPNPSPNPHPSSSPDPSQAVIMFLICFSSAGVLSCALRLAFRALFDAEHRLHAHMLARRDGARPKDMLVALLSDVDGPAEEY